MKKERTYIMKKKMLCMIVGAGLMNSAGFAATMVGQCTKKITCPNNGNQVTVQGMLVTMGECKVDPARIATACGFNNNFAGGHGGVYHPPAN
jgi:hypothetical protein